MRLVRLALRRRPHNDQHAAAEPVVGEAHCLGQCFGIGPRRGRRTPSVANMRAVAQIAVRWPAGGGATGSRSDAEKVSWLATRRKSSTRRCSGPRRILLDAPSQGCPAAAAQSTSGTSPGRSSAAKGTRARLAYATTSEKNQRPSAFFRRRRSGRRRRWHGQRATRGKRRSRGCSVAGVGVGWVPGFSAQVARRARTRGEQPTG